MNALMNIVALIVLFHHGVSAGSHFGPRGRPPSTFRAVGKGVVDDDLPPHVIEAQRQWQALHQDEDDSQADDGTYHHHDHHHKQVEMPPGFPGGSSVSDATSLEELTKQHLAEIKAKVHNTAKNKSPNANGEGHDGWSPLARTGLKLVDLGKSSHKAVVDAVQAAPTPDLFHKESPLLWLHSAHGVEVDPLGRVVAWRDVVRCAERDHRMVVCVSA